MRTLISLLIFAALGLAQTTINGGRTILGPWDASGATTTKPVKTATSDPGTCSVGELIYRTDTATLKHCSATNTWTAVGGSYSLPTASDSVLGGVKVGSGLTITDGVLAASGGSSVVCDPGDPTVACMIEEFVSGEGTTGRIGTHGWKATALSSGTFAHLNVGSNTITNHPGVFTVTSTTTAGSGGVLALANNTTNSVINLSDLLNEEWEVAWIARIGSTTDTRFRVGISVATNSIVPPTGELTLMIRYDTDAAYADNTKNTTGAWVAQMCGYSSGTCADTAGVYSLFSVTPDTNWHRFRIFRSGTTINFQIDAGTPKTMCASGCDMTTPTISSPSTFALAPWSTFGISSTTQQKAYYDWVLVKMTGLTRY